MIRWARKRAWQAIVAVVGVTIILFGGALLVLPGPGTVVIAAGLAILSIEFAWAKRLLKKVKEQSEAWMQNLSGTKKR